MPHYIKLCVLQNDLAGRDYLRETITVKLLGLAWLHLDGDENVRAPSVSGKFRHKCQPDDVFSCGVASHADKPGWQLFQTRHRFPLESQKQLTTTLRSRP